MRINRIKHTVSDLNLDGRIPLGDIFDTSHDLGHIGGSGSGGG